jgi:hypothetical protein
MWGLQESHQIFAISTFKYPTRRIFGLAVSTATMHTYATPRNSNTRRVAHSSPDFQVVTRLKFDTIRKHAFGLTPEKERPAKADRHKNPDLYHFAGLAAAFAVSNAETSL